jgi:hypothetical protein
MRWRRRRLRRQRLNAVVARLVHAYEPIRVFCNVSRAEAVDAAKAEAREYLRRTRSVVAEGRRQ